MANHEVDVTNHEPTIDEMLKWLDGIIGKAKQRVGVPIPDEAIREYLAIRTLLEQHREHNPSECGVCLGFSEIKEHNAIRAFVTRVGAKYTVEHPTVVVPEFMQPWWDALEEMDNEINE